MNADNQVPEPRADAPMSVVALPYATPAPVSGSPVAAGIWITLAGLALIGLGGCFLIGVMICSFNIGQGPGFVGANTAFIILLYALAFLSFIAAVLLMVLGIRKMLAVGR